MIYADHAASSPLRRSALEAMAPFLTGVGGNPSSVHSIGRIARNALEAARSDIATVLNCSPAEVIFTSGGTESDNLAVTGLVHGPRPRLIVSRIEHPALIQTAAHMQDSGVDVVWLDVDEGALVDVDQLREHLVPGAVCSVMYANNEVGTVQPVADIASAAQRHGALLHTDAVQAPGWLSLDVEQLGVDAMSLSAHKFGGPRGIGVLYLRSGVRLTPLLRGGSQEHGLRPGTENVAAAIGMAVALHEVDAHRERHVAHSARMRDHFVDVVTKASTRIALTGSRSDRLANHASFVVEGINGETLLIDLDEAGIACSSGSACAAGSPEVSHVLSAMGVHADLARTAVRFTFSESVTEAEIESVAKSFLYAVESLAPS